VHRNQDTKALGRMAFVILKTFLHRIEKLGVVEIRQELFEQMIQYSLVKNEVKPDLFTLERLERPAIITIEEYRKKFNID